MRKSVLAVVGVAAAIIIIGFIISRSGSNPPAAGPGTETNSEVQVTGGGNPSVQPHTRPIQVTNADPSQTPNVGVASPPPANLITNWEEKLDAIITSEDPDPEKAKKMMEMFPHLAPDAQEEVAHHISNLTPDENYAPLGKFLTNSALPEAVLDVFTEDVLNRPNSIKLPLLLDLARDPQHPKSGEAKDILELFLEEDYGTDWTKWQAKLDQWLKDNPD